MEITCIDIQNFRKLKQCRIDIAKKETVFVGANNSGKTSAMDALIIFLKKKSFSTRDFTLSNWLEINAIGRKWMEETDHDKLDLSLTSWASHLPSLDIWLDIDKNKVHYVTHLIPKLDWEGGNLGVRLRFEPDVEKLYKEFYAAFNNAKKIVGSSGDTFSLWPDDLWDYLDKKGNLNKLFNVRAYLLDPGKMNTFQDLPPTSSPLSHDILKGLIKVDIINAQRGFSDANSEEDNSGIKNLSAQLRSYYDRHLSPSENPTADDVSALTAIQKAKEIFDLNLQESFVSALGELADLNYPGFGNPTIRLSSKIDTVDGLNHDSSVQYSLSGENPKLSLPEKYNGLGYQNLISMIFKLIRFRDEWMQVGKRYKDVSEDVEFEPLHLVLIEEPEAHLHAQVQQVFIKEAYRVLRSHKELGESKNFSTQLVISTHSNHVAHEISFNALRYFKRATKITNSIYTSTVENLSDTFGKPDDTAQFAIRYLKTTHSDLFFADAVILVEGPVEKMLLPHLISKYYPKLNSCYISILEIGGSHAHKLLPLIEKLGIITLIITDIDSIDPANGNRKAEPEKGKGYKTGNDTIKALQCSALLDELLKLKPEEKEADKFPIKICFQTPIPFSSPTAKIEVAPYTFEDALVLENKSLFEGLPGSTGLLQKMIVAAKESDPREAARQMYDIITGKNVKKAEFALELLYLQDPHTLKAPKYIEEGLLWLQGKLSQHKDGIKKDECTGSK